MSENAPETLEPAERIVEVDVDGLMVVLPAAEYEADPDLAIANVRAARDAIGITPDDTEEAPDYDTLVSAFGES